MKEDKNTVELIFGSLSKAATARKQIEFDRTRKKRDRETLLDMDPHGWTRSAKKAVRGEEGRGGEGGPVRTAPPTPDARGVAAGRALSIRALVPPPPHWNYTPSACSGRRTQKISVPPPAATAETAHKQAHLTRYPTAY